MEDNIIISNPEIDCYRQVALSTKRPKVSKMFKLLGFTPHKGQQLILDSYDNKWEDYYFFILIIARRFGKTHTLVMIALTELMLPFSSTIIVAPYAKQAGIIFKDVVKYLKQLNIGFKSVNNSDFHLELENGSTMVVANQTRLDSAEGRRASLILIDEAGIMNSIDAVLNSLSPSLASYGNIPNTGLPLGRVVCSGTYKSGAKEYKQYYYKGLNKERGFVSFRLPSKLNPMNTKEFLESQRAVLDEATYKREYEAELIDVGGTDVFNSFKHNVNVIPLSNVEKFIDKDSTIIGALDVGFVDATAYLLIKVENGKYYIFDGFAESGLDEKLIAQKIKELEAKWNVKPQVRFCDPSAKMMIVSLSNNYDLYFYPAKNNVREGISTLNMLFRNEKLFITDNMKQLITEIELIEWKETTNNGSSPDPFKRVKGHHFDLVASMRYGIYTFEKSYNVNDIVVL